MWGRRQRRVLFYHGVSGIILRSQAWWHNPLPDLLTSLAAFLLLNVKKLFEKRKKSLMYRCFVCVYGCALLVPAGSRRGHQTPWNWIYTWLWASKCVLGIKARPSGRAASALSTEPSLQPLPLLFKFLCVWIVVFFPSINKDWTKHIQQLLYDWVTLPALALTRKSQEQAGAWRKLSQNHPLPLSSLLHFACEHGVKQSSTDGR